MADPIQNQILSVETVARVQAAAAEVEAEHDERLYIVRPSSQRLAAVWGEAGGSEWQDLDERGAAWFIVLGHDTDDDRCRRLAKRYGLDADGLIALRDDPRWIEFRCENWGPLQ